MVSYVQVENLTKSYGDHVLFANLTFGIAEGQKIGLVAKNGTGKSTLLRILEGVETPDSGSVIFRGGLRMASLKQHPEFGEGTTVRTACPEADNTEAHALYLRLCSQLGIQDFDVPTNKLSGGQIKRIALAITLSQNPQFIILDEPTNHLDIEAIEWLEGYLKRSKITLLMVTHDRYFLDRVCNTIFELDQQQLFIYEGNYDYYLKRRAQRIEMLEAQQEKLRNTLAREQQWMSRQPQARAGKAKFRIDNFHELKSQITNTSEKKLKLTPGSATYIGNKIFVADKINKAFGNKIILKDFSYYFARHDKIGIVGPNGVGKSTFIKMLMGIVQQDSGQWEIGTTVRWGYYSQTPPALPKGKKVIDAVTEIAENISYGGSMLTAMQYLNMFLFSAKEQQKYISTLSGGELRRLNLAIVLMKQPNFLILDEPTNDLDIITIGILEEYLASFGGCAIVISHDRYFLDNIVSHLFVMDGTGIIKDFPGTYSELRELQRHSTEPAAQAQTTTTSKSKEKPRTAAPSKLTYKEKIEFQQLEKDIETLTAQATALEKDFQNPSGDMDEKTRLYSQIKEQLDMAEMRWLELSEKL